MKELTNQEVMEILKKYDRELYEYYSKNSWYLGFSAKNYAEYLLRKHENKK